MEKQIKKILKKSNKRNEYTVQALWWCQCSQCPGCGSVPSNDFVNVRDNNIVRISTGS